MKYKYLLFDLDGTLIDTLEGVLKCAQYALDSFGIHKSLDELKPFFGPPLKTSFLAYGLSEEQAIEGISKYRERYDTIGVKESRLFPEITPLLNKLKNAGYKLGVATSKYEGCAKIILADFGIADMFDHIAGSNLDETISKKHEVIEEALKRFDISDSRQQVLMIGDMKYDDEGAKLAGVDSFGIYTGTAQPNEHENAGATYIAHSFKELEERLLNELYFE